MSAGCSAHSHTLPAGTAGFRRVLWAVIVINGGMFVIEAGGGLAAASVALQADALDFLGDTATYAISLALLGRPLRWRAAASLLKAAVMSLFGLFVLVQTARHAIDPAVPAALAMGGIGVLALAANLTAAALLYRYREGDSNIRSVWLCTRNDAVGNIAVILAAGAVAFTASDWPDLVVGAGMAALALWSAASLARQALGEWRSTRPAAKAWPADQLG